MAYTAAWSEAIPLGSLSASDIDQAIRDAKRDIRERLAPIFGMADWSADPLVPVSLSLSGFLSVGAAPVAAAGLIRAPNAQTIISARNAANSADIIVAKVTAGDLIELAAGVIQVTPVTGKITLPLAVAGNRAYIAVGAGGAVDFRTAADASSALVIWDTGEIQLSSGRLTLATSTAAWATMMWPDGALPVAGMFDGVMWIIGNDLFRRIAGVTKKVTFV